MWNIKMLTYKYKTVAVAVCIVTGKGQDSNNTSDHNFHCMQLDITAS